MRKVVSTVVLGVACTLFAGCECMKKSEQVSMQEAPQAEQVITMAVAERVPVSGTLHFAFDSEQLTAEDKASLDQLAQVLVNNPKAVVKIEGYADARGTSKYNKDLGFRRAKSVVDYLADKGIQNNQFDIQSYGSDKLLDLAQNESAHARNRRVEVSFEAETLVS